MLSLSGEVSAGVPRGTAAVARPQLAVEKSAAAVVPAGIGQHAGKGQTQSRGEGRPCSWEIAMSAANPERGLAGKAGG